VADCIAADELPDRLVAAEVLHGDKGYESNAVRRKIESKGFRRAMHSLAWLVRNR
jgi:IS5 family transposase